MTAKEIEKDVLVLRLLINDKRGDLTMTLSDKEDVEKVSRLIKLHAGMVEGAQAMIDKWEKLKKIRAEELPHVTKEGAATWSKYWEVVYMIHGEAISDLVKAYKPRMVEAGIEIPKEES